jgi:hypothetical protein
MSTEKVFAVAVEMFSQVTGADEGCLRGTAGVGTTPGAVVGGEGAVGREVSGGSGGCRVLGGSREGVVAARGELVTGA